MKTVALVGCGRISQRHREAIAGIDGMRVELVCDTDASRAAAVADELGVPYVTDYRSIEPVDLVAVLTPSGLHPRHTAEIAETVDTPRILVEKPVSITVREAYEMYSRLEAAGKVLLPVFQNRYNPLICFLKEMIDDGTLGKIHQFVCNIFWNRNDAYFNIDWHGTKELDGGVLYTQASHYVDMVHYLFGELREAKGYGGRLRGLEVHDSICTVCTFASGTVGSLNATVSTYRQNYQTELVLIAEKGTVRLSGTNLNTIDFWDVKDRSKPDIDFTIDHIYGKGHDTLYRYVAEEQWDRFPSKEDILSGIQLMEKLSY